jgi:hypothetical protein
MKKLVLIAFILLFLLNVIKAQSKHELGINYAPNYFIRTSGRLLPQKQDKIAISQKIGFIYKYRLNDKTKILTAVNYSVLKEHNNYDNAYSLPPNEYEFLYSGNSSLYINRETLSSKFYFFEIPVNINYYFYKNIFLSTGFSNSFFIKHELWTDISNKSKSIYNYRQYLVEYYLGCGFSKKLTNNVNLSINPYFQTSINDFMSTNHINTEYQNFVNQFGLNINMSYKFN